MIARDTVVDKIKSEGFKYHAQTEKEIAFINKHFYYLLIKDQSLIGIIVTILCIKTILK